MAGQVTSSFRQGPGGAESGRATGCGLRLRGDLPPGTGWQDRDRAQHVFRGEGGARRQEGPATRGRIPPQSTDDAKTGLNRDSFGTVAHPAAPPEGRASSHWTRSGRGAAANHASRPERRDEHVVTVLVLAVAGRRQRGVRLAGFDRAAGRGHSCRDELPARWAAPGPSDAFPADLPLSSAGEARESRCAAAPASLSRAPVSPPDRRASRRRDARRLRSGAEVRHATLETRPGDARKNASAVYR